MLDRVQWKKVPHKEMENFIDYVNPVQFTHNIGKETAVMKTANLPFYANANLVEIHDPELAPGITPFWFLLFDGKAFHLDGSSAPVHDVNELEPIDVNEDNVCDYVRFFCFFVHGDEGPFFIVENSDFPAFDKSKMEFPMIKDIKNKIRALEYKGMSENNIFELTGTVLYGNALFFARFAVTANGMIEMIDDEALKADIPARKIKPNY